MIELSDNDLVFSFPEVHPQAKLTVSFERSSCISEYFEDQKDQPSPVCIGTTSIEHIDDCANNLPEEWVKRGGVMLPINKSEAVRIKFQSRYIIDHNARYPFAVKIVAGKINAVTREQWTDSLSEKNQGNSASTDIVLKKTLYVSL